MIDAGRWTGNERDVMVAALNYYAVQLRKRTGRTSSTIVKSDCQWRLVAVQQALEMIHSR